MDIKDEELALFKENFKEIDNLLLKILKLNTAKLYSQNEHNQQQIHQARLEIVKIFASTRIQNCMEKIKSCGNSSRAVDVLLRLKLDLIEKEIEHCREIQLKVVEDEPGQLERQIKFLEDKKIQVELAITDANHPYREHCLHAFDMVIAKNVAKLNAFQPIDDDDLKVALCIFEIQYQKINFCWRQIFKLKLYKDRKPLERHGNILYEISKVKKDTDNYRDSFELRSCFRTIKRLTNGKCTQVGDVRLMMNIQTKQAIVKLVDDHLLAISRMTNLSIRKNEIVTYYENFKVEQYNEICQMQDMLDGNDDVGRAAYRKKVLEEFTKLNDEEIELLDKVIYNEEIHDESCPVCLNEHTDGESLVSLRCPCKRKRLCQSCAVGVLKEKSQCPCCRVYV